MRLISLFVLAAAVFSPLRVEADELCQVGTLDPSPVTFLPNDGEVGPFFSPQAGGLKTDAGDYAYTVGTAEGDGTNYRIFVERRDVESGDETGLPIWQVPFDVGTMDLPQVATDMVFVPGLGRCIVGYRDNGQISGAGGIIACRTGGVWTPITLGLVPPIDEDPYISGAFYDADVVEIGSEQCLVTVGAVFNQYESYYDGLIVVRCPGGYSWGDIFDWGEDVLSDGGTSFDLFNAVQVDSLTQTILVSGSSDTGPYPLNPDMVVVAYSPYGARVDQSSFGYGNFDYATDFHIEPDGSTVQLGFSYGTPETGGEPAWLVVRRNPRTLLAEVDLGVNWSRAIGVVGGSAGMPRDTEVSPSGYVTVVGGMPDPLDPDLLRLAFLVFEPDGDTFMDIRTAGLVDGPWNALESLSQSSSGGIVVATGVEADPLYDGFWQRKGWHSTSSVTTFAGGGFEDTNARAYFADEQYGSGRHIRYHGPSDRYIVTGGGSSLVGDGPAGAYFSHQRLRRLATCPGPDQPQTVPLDQVQVMVADDGWEPEICEPFCSSDGMGQAHSFPSPFRTELATAPDMAAVEIEIREGGPVFPSVVFEVDAFDGMGMLTAHIVRRTKATTLSGRYGIRHLPVGTQRVEVSVDVDGDGVADFSGAAPVAITVLGSLHQVRVDLTSAPAGKFLPEPNHPQSVHE